MNPISEMNSYTIIESASFVSPRDTASQNHFNFKDLNSDIRQSARKNTKETQVLAQLSTRSKVKSSLLPLQDPTLKKMAIETEEKYSNFMQSSKGIEIQKKIYESNQEQEPKAGDININYSVEEQPKQHFNLDGANSESMLPPEERGEQSNLESHLQDLTENGHTNNNNIYKTDQTNNNIHDNHEDESKSGHNVRKNIKQIACDKENKEVTKQDNSISNVCVVCFDKVPDTLYMPCGHGGLCYDCAIDILKKTGECYLCRIAISEVYQVDIKSKKDKNYKVLAVTQLVDEMSVFPESQLDIQSQNHHHNNQQQQQHPVQQNNQNELMSASFHIERAPISPSNANRQDLNIIFPQQNSQQQQIQPQSLQIQNNRNISSPDKQLGENIEKSIQEGYQQPNTLNIHNNYFQQEEIQLDTLDIELEPDQVNELVGPTSSYQQPNSPIDVDIAPSNELIQFESDEDDTEKKKENNKNDESALQQNNFPTTIQQNNSGQQIQLQCGTNKNIENGQSIISPFQSNDTCQIQDNETNSSEQEMKNQEHFHKHSMRGHVLNEGSMKSVQKIEQEDEIRIPTENS